MSGDSSADDERDEHSLEIERGITRLYQAARSRVRILTARFDPELQPAGFGILRYVMEHEPLRAGDIVAALGIDKSAVSRQLTALRDMGLVEVRPDPEDGRASLLVSSAAAHSALEVFRADSKREYERILATWTTDDIAAFARLLGQFNDSRGRRPRVG